MSGKKKHRTTNEYLQYLKGDLSKQERHAVERILESDPFEMEAMEGLEALTPDQAEEDILSLHSRLKKRIGRKRRIAWYSAAASIASLLIIGTLFFQVYEFNPEEAEKSQNEEVFAPSPSEKSDRAVQEEGGIKELDNENEDAEAVVMEPIPEVISTEVEPERIIHVEADVTPMKEETQFDYMVSEAEEAPVQEEIIIEEKGRRAKSRDERLSQPEVKKPQAMEMQKKAYSQEDYTQLITRQVSGMVVSGEDMEPLPGAAVVMKGSNSGVVTDIDGIFSIPVNDDSNTVVVASYVGMETQEYQFQEGAEIKLVLQPDALTLNDVVVVEQEMQTTDLRSPQPSVGFKAFKQYIEENIQLPDVDTSAERDIVVLKFTVSPSGEISEIVPLRSPGEPFTREAIRLIEEGPDWNPAANDKGTIEETVRLRIVFKK